MTGGADGRTIGPGDDGRTMGAEGAMGAGREYGIDGLYDGTCGTIGADGGLYDRGMEGAIGAERGMTGIMGCMGPADGDSGRGV
jgi:hypothetical protein